MSSDPPSNAASSRKGIPSILSGIGKGLFFVVVAWFGLAFIIVPIFRTFVTSLGDAGISGIGAYADYLAKPSNQQVVLNTISVGVYSVVTCGIVGTVLAIYTRFFCKHHANLVRVLLMTPLMIPGVIIVVAFLQLYGESGIVTHVAKIVLNASLPPFTGLWGIVVVITYTQYIYFYLNMSTALNFIDANIVDSVRSLSGSTWAVFRDAIWPVVRPALIVSTLMTFVSAIGSYSAPALIGGSFRVLPTQIVAAKTSFDMSLASVEVIVLLVIGVIATAGLSLLRRYYEFSSVTRARWWTPDTESTKALGWLFRLFTWLQLMGIIGPVAAILYLSFMTTNSIMMQPIPHVFTLDNYGNVFTNARTFRPLSNSLLMAVQATLIALVLVVPLVLLGRRASSSQRRTLLVPRMLELLMALPWCMPASAIAIGLINEFASPSPFSFGYALVGTFEILPLAYAVSSLPLLLSSTQVAVGGIRDTVEEAALSLGASKFRRFADVTLPAIAPGVLSGCILCFVRSVGEYTMSALLYGVYNRPISVSIVTNMQEYAVGTSMAYGTLVIVICSVLLVALLRLDGSRLGMVKNDAAAAAER